MKLILTDILEDCPSDLPSSYQLVKVSKNNLCKYSGSQTVEAIVCTRGLAKSVTQYDFPNLKLVQLFSVGYDDVDASEYQRKGIALCNASGIYDATLGEYVLYMMLSHAKRYHRSLKLRFNRPLHDYKYIQEIKGKTVGIMGVGHIGSYVAGLLSGFGVNVIGYANNTEKKEPFAQIYHKQDIESFLSQCDYLINTLPHNSSTQGLLTASMLACLKDTVVFINIGRDSIVKDKDLCQFLRHHKNATAILDRFELICNPFSEIRRLGNIYITPRISAISKESDDSLKELISFNINAMIKGEDYKNVVV